MALVMPLLLIFVTGIIQFGALMFVNAHMADVARETARRVAIGELNEVQSETYATDALINWGINYTVDTTLAANTFDATRNDITVDISAPMAEVAIIDFLQMLQGRNLNANVTMLSF